MYIYIHTCDLIGSETGLLRLTRLSAHKKIQPVDRRHHNLYLMYRLSVKFSDVGRKAWVKNSEGDDGRARSSPRAFAAFAGPASASISSRNSYWRLSYVHVTES